MKEVWTARSAADPDDWLGVGDGVGWIDESSSGLVARRRRRVVPVPAAASHDQPSSSWGAASDHPPRAPRHPGRRPPARRGAVVRARRATALGALVAALATAVAVSFVVRRDHPPAQVTAPPAATPASAPVAGANRESPSAEAAYRAAAAVAAATRPTASKPQKTAPPPARPALSLPKGTSLREGDRGPLVTRLQSALVALDPSTVTTPDGIFGTDTKKAVAAFQASEGLPADGAVGALTVSALNAELAKHLRAR